MNTKSIDVLLIGAGAMSTCLGTLLKQLDPSLKMMMVERLDKVAQESTDSLNNAGTGHAGYCELNYTPEKPDGSIDISKALEINAAFEVSLQFWSYLVELKALPKPEQFINPVPHQSFVWGEENVEFLRTRHKEMTQHAMFADMEYTDDVEVIRQWTPLIMKSRDPAQKVAATRVSYGTDVNFGEIARCMSEYLKQQDGFELLLNTNADDLEQQPDGSWNVIIKDRDSGSKQTINSRFVFLGVGGGALPLLQKSDIPECDGYAGFPVSGHWLICDKPEIVEQHLAKVYGKAAVGAPPMSVPHLDTRILDEGKALLFGPFAGFTTKFLKYGSNFDFIKSTTFENVLPMAMVGYHNFDLTRYLISESMQSHADRVESLQHYYPDAKEHDWKLATAGQRVQIIKKCDDKGGKLEFGTEVVTSADGSLSALLGASPGASVTVKAMIEVIENCFADQMKTEQWQARMKQMIPSYKESLLDNDELLKSVRKRTLSVLQLSKSTH